MTSIPRLNTDEYAPTKRVTIIFFPIYLPFKKPNFLKQLDGSILIQEIKPYNELHRPGTIRRNGLDWVVNEIRYDGSPDFAFIPKEEHDLYLKKRAIEE